MAEDWLGRWEKGNTGWHEPGGSEHLRRWWNVSAPETRVLVPLCGKSLDLLWLAQQGHRVAGVELSPVAAEAFFVENRLAYDRESDGRLDRFRGRQVPIEIFCGDYFEFHEGGPYDALFDRGALVALPEDLRADYVAHTRSLLSRDATILLVTVAYDATRVGGPPFSVPDAEVARHWEGLAAVDRVNAIDSCPPRFRESGLDRVDETVWRRGGAPG